MNGPMRVGMPSTELAGSGMQTSAALDEREARRLGRHEPIAEAELLAERDAVGLLDEQRVGPAVDREAVDLLAEDDAAGARRALEQRRTSTPRCVQLVGGAEPGDAAADDDDVDAS